ncbi:fimbrillin family protein [Bacteroides sp.]
MKRKKMKERRIFLGLSIAALALAGCSQNELIGDQGAPLTNTERTISFGSYVSRPTTSRAVGVDLTEFQNNGRFKSWAYVTTDDDGLSADLSTATHIDLHTELSGGGALDGSDTFKRVAEIGDDGTTPTGLYLWASENNKKYYWPADGLGKVSFYALSTAAGLPSASVTTLTAPTNTGGDTNDQLIGAKFDYTVGTNGTEAAEDKQEDLMAAQVYDKVFDTDAATSKIVLDFKHLLTQIRFAAKTSDNSYRVKILSLKVNGVTNQGTFTFDASAGATALGSWEYAASATKDNYVYFDATASGKQVTDFPTGFPKDDADPTKHFLGTTTVDFPLFGTYLADGSAPDNKQALIVLPSVGKDAADAPLGLKGVTIEVSYQCYILSGVTGEDGTDVAHWVEDGTVLNRKIELTENEMWTMNKKVCYILTLFNSNTGKIIYTPVVSDFEDESGSSNLYPDKDYTAPVVP